MPVVKQAEPRVSDPGIPGISALLAPLGFVREMGWQAASARIRYVRYKPSTSLVAGLELVDEAGVTSFAQAVAMGTDGGDKLAKIALRGSQDDVGRGAVVDMERGLALADATADRHLPGVRRFLRGHHAVTPLLYKPGRRWAGRHPGSTEPEMVKIHRPDAVLRHTLGSSVLGHLPVAEITRARLRRGIVHTRWVPGTPLDTLPADLGAPRLGEVGELLARIHASSPIQGMHPVDVAGKTEAAVAAIRAIAPAHAAAAQDAAHRILAEMGEPDALRVVHGDFSADQLIVRPDLAMLDDDPLPGQAPVTVIDLDRVGLDDPLADLGCWYSFHVADAVHGNAVDSVLAPLLVGYEGIAGAVDRDRLRLHCAHQVLLRAAEPFRQHQPDWPVQVQRLLSLAGGLLW